MDAQPLTTKLVAHTLGVSSQMVHKLDAILEPTRTASGVRLYDAAVVDFVAGERLGARRP